MALPKPKRDMALMSYRHSRLSIMTGNRSSEPGLTSSMPVYFGAVPCVASKWGDLVAEVGARAES